MQADVPMPHTCNRKHPTMTLWICEECGEWRTLAHFDSAQRAQAITELERDLGIDRRSRRLMVKAGTLP